MVRSYLIENRICYKGDGETNTGGSRDDSPSGGGDASFRDNERPGLISQDRPVGGTTNVRQASPGPERDRDPIVDIVSMGLGQQVVPTDVGPGDELDMNRFVDQLELEQRMAPPPPPPPAALPPKRVVPAAPPAADNTQAELARQLIDQAAQESLASPDRPAPRDSVDRAPGRNDPMSGFFADAYADLYGGTPPGTGLATIFGGGPLGSLFNTPDPADAQAFNIGQLQRMVEQTGTGTIDPNTGAVTGVQAGPGTLSMNSLGGIVFSGRYDPNYEGPVANLGRGTAGMNMAGDDDGGSQPASQPAAPVDPGTTPSEVIDDLAVNYLRDPFFLYSGQGNLFQPYGYAGGTLVDLLQTRGMTPPQQAAANLNLFGNPRDFV